MFYDYETKYILLDQIFWLKAHDITGNCQKLFDNG